MPKTVGDILSEARTILNDDAGARYTDAQLILNMNTAIAQTKGIRPDLFVMGEALPEFTVSDLTADFPLPDIYAQSFVYYVVGNAELRDDEFAVDGRAMILLNAYRRNLTGSP